MPILVTLSLVGKDVCPSQSVTVRCVVKKRSNKQLFILSWRCYGSVNENLVICNLILDFNCEFGKVVNVTGFCECEDTVIVSEATFIPNPDSAGNLTCGNGVQEETTSFSMLANPADYHLEYDGGVHFTAGTRLCATLMVPTVLDTVTETEEVFLLTVTEVITECQYQLENDISTVTIRDRESKSPQLFWA